MRMTIYNKIKVILNEEVSTQWFLTTVYTVIILCTLSYIRLIWEYAGTLLGPVRNHLIVGLYVGVAGIMYFRKKIFFTIIVLLVGMAAYKYITIPIERIHFIQYGLLGWMVWGAVKGTKHKFIIAILYIVGIGVLDEIIQGILPTRVYELRDIYMNIFGGSLGMVLRIYE